ncbi:hypothetical protein ACFSTH_13085 [Paenibacillus yanchengensis]|uniref:Lipoprotein n=1 Tax=Paenibacillus yanchengensis TaxID=2035833 RepID=A0ABW4YP37_9BACL
MRKIKIYFWLIGCTFVLLAGCSKTSESVNNGNNASNGTNNQLVTQSPLDIFDNQTSNSTRSMGSFSFGFQHADNGERALFDFTGEPISLPFYATGQDEDVHSEFGLILLVDGQIQPYTIKKGNEIISEEQVMNQFTLAHEETVEFDAVFTPQSGRKGERVGVAFVTILQPDYQPENIKNSNFGMYHHLSSTTYQEIEMKDNGTGQKKAYKETTMEDIPQGILDLGENVIIDGVANYLDAGAVIKLIGTGEEQDPIVAVNGKTTFKFQIYGGVEATYNTTIFINHQPVKVNGNYDYITTKTAKGKLTTVAVEIDTTELEEINTIYAVTGMSERDYLTDNVTPHKTKSRLLINK